MRPARFIVFVLTVVLAIGGLAHEVAARPLNCFVSSTTVPQGGSFTISGPSDVNAEHIVALLDSATVIGQGFTNTTGTPITFAFTATIPSTTSPDTSHTLQVRNDAGEVAPCPNIFVTAAATPSPSPVPATPTPTPAPTAAPIATPTFVFVPVPVVQQQQQQQQQQQDGGGAVAPERRPGPGRQHQFRPAPVFVPTGGVALPKTGTEIAMTAAIGIGLVGFGLLLLAFTRRRRRRAARRALAELPPIDAVVVEPDQPWLPGTPHPSEFLTEADGLPPVSGVLTAPLSLPAPVHDDDILTPSF